MRTLAPLREGDQITGSPSSTSPLVGELADERNEAAGRGLLVAANTTPHPPNVVSSRRRLATSPTRGEVGDSWNRVSSFPNYAVLLFVAFLLFFQLGHRAMYSSHEARAAQNAQRMLDTGEWGLPVLFDGQVDLQKPPGYYWLVAMAGWLNGGTVTAFEARLPAALAGLLTVGMVFFFLRSEGRPKAATIAAIVLATAIHFTAIARTARIDVPLTCAVTASLLAFFKAHTGGRVYAWCFASAVAAAGGILLKGPIALALIGPVAMIWIILCKPTRGRGWAVGGGYCLGIATVLTLSAPWFMWANHATQGEFLRVFFWHHNVERFTGASPTLASHPWWYYGPRFAADFLPWTPVLIWTAFRALRSADSASRLNRFAVIWFAAMFLVLSASQFKRADYLLPLYPAAAIYIGCAAEALAFQVVARCRRRCDSIRLAGAYHVH